MSWAAEHQGDDNWMEVLGSVKDIAREAGEIILKVYGEADAGIRIKSDDTPVTRADLEANQIITEGLESLRLGYPVLTEESEHLPLAQRQLWQRHWLVDPLDGTNEFIHKNGQFTVNIGLIEQNYPLVGLVYVPVTDTFYYGGKTVGAFCQKGENPPVNIKTRKIDKDNIIVLGSRSYNNAETAKAIEVVRSVYPHIHVRSVGSALKGCMIAEGKADIYPRRNGTSEWDTAAVQAVVEGAGGIFLDPDGNRFSYNNHPSLKNPDFLIAGDPEIDIQRTWLRS